MEVKQNKNTNEKVTLMATAIEHHEMCVMTTQHCLVTKALRKCARQETAFYDRDNSANSCWRRLKAVSARRYTRYALPSNGPTICSKFRFIWPIELNDEVRRSRATLSFPDVNYKLHLEVDSGILSSTDSKLAALVYHRETGNQQSAPGWCNTLFGILCLQLNFPRRVANLIVIQALICDNSVSDNTLLQMCKTAPIELLEEMMRHKKAWYWSCPIALFPSRLLQQGCYGTTRLNVDFLQDGLDWDAIPQLEYQSVSLKSHIIDQRSLLFDYIHLDTFDLVPGDNVARRLHIALPIMALFLYVHPCLQGVPQKTFPPTAVSLHMKVDGSPAWPSVNVPTQQVSNAPGWLYVPVADLQMSIDDAIFGRNVDSLMATSVLDNLSISFHGIHDSITVDVYARTANILVHAKGTQAVLYLQ